MFDLFKQIWPTLTSWLKSLPPGLAATILIVMGLGLATLGWWLELDSDRQLQLWVAAIAFVVWGVALLQSHWRKRHPRITNRRAFLEEQLRGRDKELEELIDRIRTYPMVWLLGKSGIGKSTLLELGVLDKLKNDSAILPLYLTHWGSDWVQGPRVALARALEKLDHSERKKLGIGGNVEASAAVTLLGEISEKIGRKPLLICDQFDDYLITFQKEFLRLSEAGPTSYEEAIHGNPFWASVKELFVAGKVKCLFAVRTDSEPLLAPFSFGESISRLRLQRVERTAFEEQLEELTAKYVENAHPRFKRLYESVLDDLSDGSWILPIRYKIAKRALINLKPLDRSSYSRQGKLTGLERRYVLEQMEEAAYQAGFQVTDVHCLLKKLIDPEEDKTLQQNEESLLVCLPEPRGKKTKKEALEIILSSLRTGAILRKGFNDDGETAVWLLDHDYLCQSILQLEEGPQLWTLHVENAATIYDNAQTLGEVWRALLPISTQLVLFWEYLHGRFRYNRARKFAVMSLLRFWWTALIPLAILGWNVALDRRTQQIRLTLETRPPEAWHALAREWRPVRRRVLQSFLENRQSARFFLRQADSILHAVIGLDADDREEVLKPVVRNHCFDTEPAQPEFTEACAEMISLLPASEGAVQFFSRAIEESESSDAIRLYALSLAENLSTKSYGRATEAVDRLIEKIKQETIESRLRLLSEGTAALVAKLPEGATQPTSRKLLDGLEGAQVAEQARAFAVVLAALGNEVPPDVCEEAAEALVEKLEKASAVVHQNSLISGLSSLLPVAPAASAERILDRSLEALKANSIALLSGKAGMSYLDMEAFGDALSRIAVRLPKGSAEPAWTSVTKLVELGFTGDRLGYLAEMLNILTQRLPEEAAERLTGRMLEIVRSADSDERLNAVGYAFSAFGERLPRQVADLLSRRLEDLLDGAGIQTLAKTAEALGALGDQLSTTTRGRATELLVAAAEGSSSAEEAQALADILDAMGPAVSKEAVVSIVEPLLEELVTQEDVKALRSLGFALGSLGERLPDATADRAAHRFLERIHSTEDTMDLRSLLLGLAHLDEKLTPSHLEKILQSLGRQAGRENLTPSERYHLVESYSPLWLLLDPEDTTSTVTTVLDWWLFAAYPMPNPTCASVVPLVRRSGTGRILDLLKWPTCTAADREILLTRLGEVNDQFFDDVWAFADWAKAQGFSVEQPPRRPQKPAVPPI